MRKTLRVPLEATEAECALLDATVQAYGAACAHAVDVGLEEGTTSNALIHRRVYRTLRRQYGLNANLAIRAIAHAARLLKERPRTAPDPSVEYDPRIFSVRDEGRAVSLATLGGRLRDIRTLATPEQQRQLRAGHAVRAVLSRTDDAGYVLAVEIVLPHGDTPPPAPGPQS